MRARLLFRVLDADVNALWPAEGVESSNELRADFIRQDIARRDEDQRAASVMLLVKGAHIFHRDRVDALDQSLARRHKEGVRGIEDDSRKTLIAAIARVGLLFLNRSDGLLLELLQFVCRECGLAQLLCEGANDERQIFGERASREVDGERVR